MEEFIDNFNEFRDWLYQAQTNCLTPEHREAMDMVVRKFEELGLNDAF